MESKRPWESKTVICGVLAALIPLFPPAAAWAAANPELYSAALGGIFAGLRLITKGRVTIG